MGIFPRRDREARIKGLNKLLKKTAKEAGAGFNDPGQVFLRKGKIDESLFLDGLHPNEAGYELIAPYYN
jgi:lysophospholipase L1-like esterase